MKIVQNFYSWQNEIDTALSFGLEHISLYQLTIEEGTVFYKKNGNVVSRVIIRQNGSHEVK